MSDIWGVSTLQYPRLPAAGTPCSSTDGHLTNYPFQLTPLLLQATVPKASSAFLGGEGGGDGYGRTSFWGRSHLLDWLAEQEGEWLLALFVLWD